MGKVIRAIGVVAAIAVNVIPGVGQAVSGALLGALAGAGIYVSVGTALALASGAILAGTAALAGTGRRGQVATGISGQVQINPDSPQWFGVGRTALPSQVLYFGSAGTDNKAFSQILMHSCLPINAFVGMRINNRADVTSGTSTTFTGTGEVKGAPSLNGNLPVLVIETVTGTQTTSPFTHVRGGEWGSAMVGNGLPMTHLRWAFEQKALASGLPSSVQPEAECIYVYDPRRDSTRGGSGSMRADDQTTWAYKVSTDEIGRNPALLELSYRIGWRQNGRLKAGMGEDLFNLDYASYIAAANVCDEDVDGTKRYQCDGLLQIGPGDIHNVNLSRIHGSCGGKQVDVGGLIGFWVAHDDTDTVAMAFDDGDIKGPLEWDPLPNDGLRNTARGSYINPLTNYSAVPYQEVAPSDLRAIDNGQELAEPLDFGMVTREAQARRLASIRLREGRQGTLRAPFSLKALGALPQKIVTITHPRWGWTAKKFRVEEMALGLDRVQLRLRAVAAGDYVDVTTVPDAIVTVPATDGFLPIVPLDVENGATLGDNRQTNWDLLDGSAGYNLASNQWERVAAPAGFLAPFVLRNTVTAMSGGSALIFPRVRVTPGDVVYVTVRVLRAHAVGALTMVVNRFEDMVTASGQGTLGGTTLSIVPTAADAVQTFQVFGRVPADTRAIEIWIEGLTGATIESVRIGDARVSSVEQGAGIAANSRLDLPTVQTFNAGFDGTISAGQQPRDVQVRRFRGEQDVTTTTSWTVNGIGCSASVTSAGVVTINSVVAAGLVEVTGTRDGVPLEGTIETRINRAGAPPPSGAATVPGNISFTTASGSFVTAVSATVTVPGGGSQVAISSQISVFGASGAAENTEIVWQRETSPGTWADVGAVTVPTIETIWGYTFGQASISRTITSLSGAQNFRLRVRRTSGSGDQNFSGDFTLAAT